MKVWDEEVGEICSCVSYRILSAERGAAQEEKEYLKCRVCDLFESLQVEKNELPLLCEPAFQRLPT